MKVVRQRVQVVALVHDWQLAIAVEHYMQLNPEVYWVLVHDVQVGPLDASLQRVQYEELVHWVQFGIAEEHWMQVEED